jgi:hypothetical protein
MAKLKDVIAYILLKYPEHLRDELSNFRVTKMIYLSDWHFARKHGEQITEIKWFFDNFGPFVWDIKNIVEENTELFEIKHTKNIYGDDKKLFILQNKNYKPEITEDEKESLDYVIGITKKLYSGEFTNLIYSTYPILTSDKYTYLDLVCKAKEYSELEKIKKG